MKPQEETIKAEYEKFLDKMEKKGVDCDYFHYAMFKFVGGYLHKCIGKKKFQELCDEILKENKI